MWDGYEVDPWLEMYFSVTAVVGIDGVCVRIIIIEVAVCMRGHDKRYILVDEKIVRIQDELLRSRIWFSGLSIYHFLVSLCA